MTHKIATKLQKSGRDNTIDYFYRFNVLEKIVVKISWQKVYLPKCGHFLKDDVICKVTRHINGLLSMKNIKETLLITNTSSNKDTIKGL